jgi:hypothetical protein
MSDSKLEKWLDDINLNGRAGWIRFYKELMNRPLSSPEQFWNALEQYGDFPVFEAVILSSRKKIDGDPLPYILSVAHRKWRESIESDATREKYARDLEHSKESTAERNADLAHKLQRARESSAEHPV